MGSGAAKQPKIKKIYVHSKDTENFEDEEKSLDGDGAPPRPIGEPSVADASGLEALAAKSTAKARVEASVDPNPKVSAGTVTKSASKIKVPGSKPNAGKNADDFSPRSFSSDEGENPFGFKDEGGKGDNPFKDFNLDQAAATEPTPYVIPKPAFAEVLKEGYQRQAQERSDWLRSLAAAHVEPVVLKADEQTLGTRANHGTGFNDTKPKPAVLRDPDIFAEVRKWNTKMKRDEVPMFGG